MPNNRKARSKGSAKSTVSGPSKSPRGPGNGPAERKMQGTQDLAAAFPFNASKPGEIGAAARTPKAGATARHGLNPSNQPLDRVRVDSGGQTLTTNFAQPIADNQNSLKVGLRGPALLED